MLAPNSITRHGLRPSAARPLPADVACAKHAICCLSPVWWFVLRVKQPIVAANCGESELPNPVPATRGPDQVGSLLLTTAQPTGQVYVAFSSCVYSFLFNPRKRPRSTKSGASLQVLVMLNYPALRGRPVVVLFGGRGRLRIWYQRRHALQMFPLPIFLPYLASSWLLITRNPLRSTS